MMNNIISFTSFIGLMSELIGFGSLVTYFLDDPKVAFNAMMLGDHSGVSYALALIVGGAAVLAPTVIAATLRGQEL